MSGIFRDIFLEVQPGWACPREVALISRSGMKFWHLANGKPAGHFLLVGRRGVVDLKPRRRYSARTSLKRQGITHRVPDWERSLGASTKCRFVFIASRFHSCFRLEKVKIGFECFLLRNRSSLVWSSSRSDLCPVTVGLSTRRSSNSKSNFDGVGEGRRHVPRPILTPYRTCSRDELAGANNSNSAALEEQSSLRRAKTQRRRFRKLHLDTSKPRAVTLQKIHSLASQLTADKLRKQAGILLIPSAQLTTFTSGAKVCTETDGSTMGPGRGRRFQTMPCTGNSSKTLALINMRKSKFRPTHHR